jgi:hypothetical protein
MIQNTAIDISITLMSSWPIGEAAPPSTDALLLEIWDYLLLETWDKLLLEA